MKRLIRFSKLFVPAAIFSAVLAVLGITGYVYNKGFNLGVDFKPGLIQEVQFAPSAFGITWSGAGNAILSFDRNNIYIVNSGAGIENRTFVFPFSEYRTAGAITDAMVSQLDGISVNMISQRNVDSQWFVFSTQGNPYLSSDHAFVVHYLNPASGPIAITDVREAMASIQGVSVQSMGQPQDRQFMIRIEDRGDGQARSEMITGLMEAAFGRGEVVALRSDFVGSRFAKNLTDQAGMLVTLTLLLILIYSSIRFKPQYGVGAVLGIIHDGLVIIGFVAWTRMEFNTTTIAAILTILGYSTNNTIVVFDRIRENLRIYPDDSYVDILDKSLTGVLNRTIITTVTTMLAVLSLYIFTTGAMKDFALALIVGLICGVYTTTFIVSGFALVWEKKKIQRAKKKQALAQAVKKSK